MVDDMELSRSAEETQSMARRAIAAAELPDGNERIAELRAVRASCLSGGADYTRDVFAYMVATLEPDQALAVFAALHSVVGSTPMADRVLLALYGS
jgi:hypothetical protein